MSKRYNLRRIRRLHAYTAPGLARTLKINIGTIRRWSSEGLKPIDRKRPFLFFGEHVIQFLRARIPPPIRLAPGELLCVRCNAARFPANFQVHLIPRGPTTVDLSSRCGTCGCGMLRRSRISEIEQNRGPCQIACPDDQATMVRSGGAHQMSLFEEVAS